MQVAIERTRDVYVPQYGSEGAACFDLQIGAFLSPAESAPVGKPADEDRPEATCVLPPGMQVWAGAGIRVQLPDGYGLMLLPRSGKGACEGLVLGNTAGVIDSDFRSEIKLALLNRSRQTMILRRGDRVAQGWILPAPQAEFVLVDDIEQTGRGEFGSSGR